jgi:PEGA domain
VAYPRSAAWATVFALLAFSAPVVAQTKADEARAAELKKQGDDLVHEAKFREALELYDQSFALVPNPAIHYNRARALQSVGDFPAALEAFEKFVATAAPDLKARVPNLDKMVADVAAHVATLVITCKVDGATVTLSGKTLGTTPLKPYRTDGGDATITVTAPGYVVFNQDTTLTPGESTTITVDLKKAASEQTNSGGPEPTPFDANAAPTQAHEKPPAQAGSGVRTFAWVSGTLGLVSLAGGMVFLGLAVADKGSADPHCPNKVCDATGQQSINQAWTFATVSTVLVVVGAVGLTTSLVSFIVSPKSSPVQARLFLTPTVAGGFAGLGGTF